MPRAKFVTVAAEDHEVLGALALSGAKPYQTNNAVRSRRAHGPAALVLIFTE